MSKLISTPEELQEFISYVVLYAPDRFPRRSYQAAAEWMDLARAFDEIATGLHLIWDDVLPRSQELLSQSRIAYESGNDITGARLLQELQRELFG